MVSNDAVSFSETRGGIRNSVPSSNEQCRHAMQFLDDYVGLHAHPDSGRAPSSSNTVWSFQLLYYWSYEYIFDEYWKQCESDVIRSVSINQFWAIWKYARPFNVWLSQTSDMSTTSSQLYNLALSYIGNQGSSSAESTDSVLESFRKHSNDAENSWILQEVRSLSKRTLEE